MSKFRSVACTRDDPKGRNTGGPAVGPRRRRPLALRAGARGAETTREQKLRHRRIFRAWKRLRACRMRSTRRQRSCAPTSSKWSGEASTSSCWSISARGTPHKNHPPTLRASHSLRSRIPSTQVGGFQCQRSCIPEAVDGAEKGDVVEEHEDLHDDWSAPSPDRRRRGLLLVRHVAARLQGGRWGRVAVGRIMMYVGAPG